MAKFGLYEPGSNKPLQEYDGDYLIVHGESVSVIARDEKGIERTVAVIRLAERQSVKKVVG
jgi:hypothetical protein